MWGTVVMIRYDEVVSGDGRWVGVLTDNRRG